MTICVVCATNLRDFESDIFKTLTDIFDDEALTSYQAFYSALLDYVDQSPLLAKAVISNFEHSMQSALFQDMVEYLLAACKEAWRRENGQMELIPQMEYFAEFRVHGIIAMIGHWINSGYALPLEEVKKMISELDKKVDAFIISYSKHNVIFSGIS